jgi:hypothetical protein
MWAWRIALGALLLLALLGVASAGDAVCTTVVDTKTKTRTCYALKTELVCLTRKPCHAGCDPCGKPREVRKLIKRFVKEVTTEVKCVPCVKECGPPHSK